MNDSHHPVIFIIPALNEDGTVGAVVSSLKKYGEVVVVDDGSTDSTTLIAQDKGAQVISHQFRSGYDQAIITGFNYALSKNFQWAITVDADGQHDITNIPLFLSVINSSRKIDLLIGIREVFPRVGEKIMSYFFRLVWGVFDPLCGLKAYNLDFYRNNLPVIKKTFDSIGTEIMLNYLVHNSVIHQESIKILERIDAPRYGDTWRVNIRILKSIGHICSNFLFKKKNNE
ncbi:glycosyltransferase family 2 protein [Polynucleobacter paneuropaeus]|nr:glycosyltransferase family 2 protein [Polynucleobacter paneuropaeus]